MVGLEGMLGAHMAPSVDTAPLHALVQGSGVALRIGAAAVKKELASSVALQCGLHRYVYVLMSQLATSAACLRCDRIGPRLARWLLISQDHSNSKSFHLMHEFLAFMLGVRRVGITSAAGALQRAGLIQYQRSDFTVLDREGLEAAACGCYQTDRGGYTKRI